MKFIDFIHRPEINAECCDYFGFPATANTPARQLKNDVGADLVKYNAAWQEFKVGK